MPTMPQQLIKDKQIIRNSWQLLDSSAGVDVLAEFDGCDVLIPLCCWLSEQPHIAARNGWTAMSGPLPWSAMHYRQ